MELPCTLDRMLATALSHDELKGWSIYTERDGKYCIKLRFEPVKDSHFGQSGDRKAFKEKSLKQRERDFNRSVIHCGRSAKPRGSVVQTSEFSEISKQRTIPAVHVQSSNMISEMEIQLDSRKCVKSSDILSSGSDRYKDTGISSLNCSKSDIHSSPISHSASQRKNSVDSSFSDRRSAQYSKSSTHSSQSNSDSVINSKPDCKSSPVKSQVKLKNNECGTALFPYYDEPPESDNPSIVRIPGNTYMIKDDWVTDWRQHVRRHRELLDYFPDLIIDSRQWDRNCGPTINGRVISDRQIDEWIKDGFIPTGEAYKVDKWIMNRKRHFDFKYGPGIYDG